MNSRIRFLFVAVLFVDATVSRSFTKDDDASNLLITKNKLLRNFNSKFHNENPEEMGPYTEGDIIYAKKLGRNGLVDPIAHWPHGEVPYIINGTFDKRELEMLEEAFTAYHYYTCIKFMPRTDEEDYIAIQNTKTGCWANLGRTGGQQGVNLQLPACMYLVGTAIHELMHALGFYHEQNRSERDDFIKIDYGNIRKSSFANFDKLPADTISGFDVGYDYDSVMHYSPYAFSTNKKPTIIPLKDAPYMGQRYGFSLGDVQKINKMYNCPAQFEYVDEDASEQ